MRAVTIIAVPPTKNPLDNDRDRAWFQGNSITAPAVSHNITRFCWFSITLEQADAKSLTPS